MLRDNKENGYALVQTLVLLMVSSIVIAAMIKISRYSMAEYDLDSDYDSALFLAMSGLEKTKQNISEAFTLYLYDSPNSGAPSKVKWFDEFNKQGSSVVSAGRYKVDQPKESKFFHAVDDTDQSEDSKLEWRTDGKYSVNISSFIPGGSKTNGVDPFVRYVKVQVEATVGNSTRKIEEVIKYGLESVITQYAYFQNQPMFVKPTAMMRFNGDLRSNGNTTFLNNDGKIAGDVYASVCPDFGALGLGNISGKVSAVPLGEYNTNANTGKQARPVYEDGYNYGYHPLDAADGQVPKVREFANEPQIYVPPLGNLELYKNKNASIKQGNNTIVRGHHSSTDVGIDGISGSPDDGSLYLEGTKDNPVEINGSVVVEGDVVIKGYIKGHGCIYASKNIHVIGDVKYVNPPEWNKPGTTVDNQLNKDLVGFMSKGNIVFGNSEKIDQKSKLLKAAYPHGAPDSDADNGFDSDNNITNGVEFDGDYSKYATAYNNNTKQVENLKRTDSLPRERMNLNNNFYIANQIKKVQRKWIPPRYKKIYEYKQVLVNTGGIGSSAQEPKYETKKVEIGTELVKPGYWKEAKVSWSQNFGYPPSDKEFRENRSLIRTNQRNLKWGSDIRKGDKILINGEEYTVVAGNSGYIKVGRSIPGDKGQTVISSVELPYRPYSVKDKRYYEPTVQSDFIEKNAESAPSHFDGVYFTNHLIAGFVNNITVNGSIVTRDSAFQIKNRATFNWDMRLAVAHGSSNMASMIGLPKNHSNVSVYWREL